MKLNITIWKKKNPELSKTPTTLNTLFLYYHFLKCVHVMDPKAKCASYYGSWSEVFQNHCSRPAICYRNRRVILLSYKNI